MYIQVLIYILNTFPHRRWQFRNQLNLTVFYHMELESFKKAQGRVALYRLGDTWTFELTAKNEFLHYQKCFYLKCLSLSCFILEKMLMFRSQKIYTESDKIGFEIRKNRFQCFLGVFCVKGKWLVWSINNEACHLFGGVGGRHNLSTRCCCRR